MSDCTDNQDVGLEAATIERVRNSSLVKCSRADNVTGLKPAAEAVGFSRKAGSVGEHPQATEAATTSQPWRLGKRECRYE